jgi:hydrophobic/amphiphilic exporter-1 (mainly G- bacteria), HAE1 family
LFRWFNAAFDRTTSGYTSAVRSFRAAARPRAGRLRGFCCSLTGWGFARLPTGFVPVEDQGYVFANVQLPDAASLGADSRVRSARTTESRGTRPASDVISVAGYSLLSGTNSSNMGMVFIVFDPWEDRRTTRLSQEAILASLRRQFGENPRSDRVRIRPSGDRRTWRRRWISNAGPGPARPGMPRPEECRSGNGRHRIDQSGFAESEHDLQRPRPAVVRRGGSDQGDESERAAQCDLRDTPGLFGSAYVNDFNRFGRTYQVRVQADQQYRTQADDIQRLDVRNADGAMVPLGTLVTVRPSSGAQVITRYNLYPSAQINGEAAPGFSSGDALTLMEQMADCRIAGRDGL